MLPGLHVSIASVHMAFGMQIPGFKPWLVGKTNDHHTTELSLSLQVYVVRTVSLREDSMKDHCN
jgi:hypothetical protein